MEYNRDDIGDWDSGELNCNVGTMDSDPDIAAASRAHWPARFRKIIYLEKAKFSTNALFFIIQ
jgi:hypothetical protein